MEPKVSHLRRLRTTAGLSLRELARQIGEQPTNLSYWERTGNPPRAEVLIPIAEALGVTVYELLGQTDSKRKFGGKLGQLFQEVSNLPRRQQERITGVLEDMLTAQKSKLETDQQAS